MEYREDTAEMMMNNLKRVPQSDRIVLSKLFGMIDTPYGETIGSILSDIINRWGFSDKDKYLEVKLESIKDAVRTLWVKTARKSETFKIFDEFETFERILFRSNNQRRNNEYRGHYVHQFDVFLLGYYILNKLLENGTLNQLLTNKSANPNFTWLLTGTFHDMGYPIERIDYWFSDILKAFLKIETQYQIEIDKVFPPIFSKYIEFLSQWAYDPTALMSMNNTQLLRDWHFHNLLETNLRNKNHSVISSLLLMHSFLTSERVAQNSSWMLETFPNEVLPACHAIALHNLQDEAMRIELNQHPYAFLLMLCDSIQDWQRSIGQADYSELNDITVDSSGNIPKIVVNLQVQNKKKNSEFDELVKKLETNGLVEIEIGVSNQGKNWKF